MSARPFQRSFAALAVILGLAATLAGLGLTPPAVAAPVGTDARPLILLIDVSGSMDENGGNGLSKLDGAKGGMKNAISSGNLVGLWTYPSDGNCSGGGYVPGAEPVARQDAAKLKAIISGLTASGNTPTAQALEALGADLTRRGFTSANIVLVSDGESNCSPPKPPCQVAKDLVAQGFDITINTIGFSISSAGRDELTCIADSTNGKYVDVNDSQAVIEELQRQVTPQLKLTATSIPEPAIAGGRVSVTATVENTSTQQLISDVTVTLTFRANGTDDVMLPVVPPRSKLGNLPPGQTASKTWDFSLNDLSVQNKRGTYRAVAYGYLSDGTYVDGQITIDTSAVETTGPFLWGVQIDGDDQIVIMGDSFSSGQGAGTYENWETHEEYATTADADGCHTSQLTYGRDGRYKIKNLACSGAVMSNFANEQSHCKKEGGNDVCQKTPPQFSKLRDLKTPPRIVFLTIGGNDIGFVPIVEKCLDVRKNLGVYLSGCDQQSITDAIATIDNRSDGEMDAVGPTERLAKLYQAVWNGANSDAMRQARVAAGGNEYAPVVVLPYVHFLDTTGKYTTCDLTPGVDFPVFFAPSLRPADIYRLNDLQTLLNAAILSEVKAAAADGKYGIYFADGLQDALVNHSICASVDGESWMVPVTSATQESEEAMHPNAAGYQAIGRSLRTFLRSPGFTYKTDANFEAATTARDCPETPAPDPNDPLAVDGLSVRSLTKCDYLWVSADGLAPNSTTTVAVRSSPLTLASVTADADGKVLALVRIPGWIEPGVHQLTVTGIDSQRDVVRYSVEVRIAEAVPWYVWGIGAASAAALLAGIVMVLVARSRRKRAQV